MSLSLWTHCDAATMQTGAAQPYGLVPDAALVTEGEVIRWIGPHSDLPADLQNFAMFVPRKPLSAKAKRHGWQGFMIDLRKAVSQPICLT